MHVDTDMALPPLRDELQLLEAARDGDGRAGYLIFDPVRHAYFRIGMQAARVLAHWGAGSVERLIEKAKAAGLQTTREDILAVLNFASLNNLTREANGGSQALSAARARAKRSILSNLVHSYLFFKIPLLHPQKLLNKTLPMVRFLGSRTAKWLIIFLALAGIYMAMRQWDVFVHNFTDFTSASGLVYLAVAIVILKTGHELGHAYVATAYKCKVPVMGVAFIVMFPMLFSDVTDAWRLTSRRQRLMVDAAGMLVEMSMAAVALFLWAFVPDGPFRQLCFFIATTGWVMSLAINLSPLMRFDGYHILADILGIHNLQARGFALGRWKLREWLFGLDEDRPEHFPARLHKILIAYAFATWIYRFFLFVGIAMVVYFMFFKVLGVVLFAIEIGWFVALPIWREIKAWWQRRAAIIGKKRAWRTAGLFGLGVVCLFLPLDRKVHVPAVLAMASAQRVYAPVAARVVDMPVRHGQKVAAGDVLVRLSSPLLKHQLRLARARLELNRVRLHRGVADGQDLALRAVLARESAALAAQIKGLQEQSQALDITANHAGVVSFVGRGLRRGVWVNPKQLLVHIVAATGPGEAHGLVGETDVTRLTSGAAGVFVPDNPLAAPVAVTFQQSGLAAQRAREVAFLSSLAGGPVAYRANKDGQMRPVTSMYRALFVTETAQFSGLDHEQRGVVVVKGTPVSLAGQIVRRVIAVLLRESGV